MLTFVPDHVKIKKCVNMQLKNYRNNFVVRYVPD